MCCVEAWGRSAVAKSEARSAHLLVCARQPFSSGSICYLWRITSILSSLLEFYKSIGLNAQLISRIFTIFSSVGPCILICWNWIGRVLKWPLLVRCTKEDPSMLEKCTKQTNEKLNGATIIWPNWPTSFFLLSNDKFGQLLKGEVKGKSQRTSCDIKSASKS